MSLLCIFALFVAYNNHNEYICATGSSRRSELIEGAAGDDSFDYNGRIVFKLSIDRYFDAQCKSLQHARCQLLNHRRSEHACDDLSSWARTLFIAIDVLCDVIARHNDIIN
jgi:hypothetical protein